MNALEKAFDFVNQKTVSRNGVTLLIAPRNNVNEAYSNELQKVSEELNGKSEEESEELFKSPEVQNRLLATCILDWEADDGSELPPCDAENKQKYLNNYAWFRDFVNSQSAPTDSFSRKAVESAAKN